MSPFLRVSLAEAGLVTRRGAILPLFAITFAALLLFLGLVADGGMIYFERRRAQVAADAAAYAGTLELLHNNSAWVTASAKDDTKINGFDDDDTDIVITVNNPPLSGSAAGNANAVEVIVQSTVKTTLMQLVANDTTVVRARAVATVRPDSAPMCILALNESAEGSIIFNGTIDMNVPDCEIIARSNHEEAIEALGGPCVTARAIGYGSGGGYIDTGNGSCLDPLPLGVIPPEDPYENLPAPDPTAYTVQSASRLQRTNADGAETFQPGVYTGGIKITGGGPYTFAPGMYIVDGLEIAGGTVLGDNITIYNTGSGLKNVSINGNGTVNLTASTSGTYENVLFYNNRNMTSTNPNDGKIVGTGSSTFEGAIYFPSVHLDWGGNSDVSIQTYTQVIADTLRFHGTAQVSGNYGFSTTPRNPTTNRVSFLE